MSRRLLPLVFILALGACASGPPQDGRTRFVTARLQETARLGGLTIRPYAVQDTRCPADALCVQSGTVVIQAEFRYSGGGAGMPRGGRLDTSLSLQHFTSVGPFVTFVAACPYPLASRPVPTSAYRFVFAVSSGEPELEEGRDYCAEL